MKRHSRFWSAVAACLIAQLAQAHARLQSSTPADGSTVSAAPAALEMTFSEPARLTALWIQRAEEPRQALKSLPVSTDKTLRVALPTLAAGSYSVTWRAVSADGHIASGTVRFTISPAAR